MAKKPATRKVSPDGSWHVLSSLTDPNHVDLVVERTYKWKGGVSQRDYAAMRLSKESAIQLAAVLLNFASRRS